MWGFSTHGFLRDRGPNVKLNSSLKKPQEKDRPAFFAEVDIMTTKPSPTGFVESVQHARRLSS